MKKYLLLFFAIPAFVGCLKEVGNHNPVATRKVDFAAGPIETRTVFGTPSGTIVPTLWTENKTVGISLNFATMKESTTPELSNGGSTANFSADIKDASSSSYTFYAVSPYSSVISVSDSYYSVQVDIPASQTPLATSVDENAQILIAKHSAGSSFPSSVVAMEFDHLTAYGKISFSNLSLATGETIESVSLTAAENWVGRYYYYFEDHDPNSEGDIVAHSAGNTLTLSTSSSTDIWFACAPVDLGGKNVKVVITTDKATTYTKTITIPAGKSFTSGKVNAFTINMNGITSDSAAEFELVTDPSELTVGRQVIIAAPGDNCMAMSTTQNNNNRGSASITKSQNNTLIVGPSDAVQIFTIVAGTKSGTVAFNTGSGYIYAASKESNYLKTEETLSANSSWEISIDSDGIATVIAQGANTRNEIRYNGGNNPPVFSCYASSSSVVTKVSFFVPAANWQLNSIAVTTAPDKTSYEAGENFDPTGMIVTAHYVDADDNTHTKDVVLNNENLTIAPSASLTEGTTSVNISYDGKSTTQAITVIAPITWDLKSIAVTTAPTKVTYAEGEYFDPAGMVVTATYENHDNTSQTKTETVDNADLTFSPTTATALTTSNTAITITYDGKSTSQSITVNAVSSEYYELVTTVNDVTTGDYVIVGKTGNTYYAMPGVSTGKISGTEITVTDDKIDATTGDSYAITITKNSGSVAIGSGSTYLQIKTSGTDFGTTSTANYYPITVSDGAFDISNTRHLAWRNTSNVFGNYASIYTSEYCGVYLFKKVDNTVWDLKSIAVTSAPTKTTYEVGEYFDPSGLVVTATYEDHAGVKSDKTETVDNSDLSFSPTTSTALTTSNDEITISYRGQSTTQSITVVAITWDLKSIAVTTAPTKTTYTAGEYFDPTGMVVTATYENHDNTSQTKTETVDNADLTFSPTTATALTTGDTAITISYNGQSTIQDITVTATKTEYTLTITPSQFVSSSYANNNNEKTTTATSSGSSTYDVKWTSNQVMLGTGDNAGKMQWQKNNGYIYNSTNLGTIKSVTVNSSTGSFTTYYGTTEHPTSGTNVGNGFFTVKVGGATGVTKSIVVVFEN